MRITENRQPDTTSGGRRRLRVLVVTSWYPDPGKPSVAPFVLRHVQALAREHDVEVFHTDLARSAAPAAERYEGTHVTRMPASPRSPLLLLGTLGRLRRAAGQADIVHSMAFSSALVVAVALVAHRARRRWIHTEHWSGVRDPESVSRLWVRISWLRWVLHVPRRLSAVSTVLADTLERFGRPGAVSVVPCVVENPRPVIDPVRGDALRLVAIGGLVAGKQPLVAAQVVATLIERGVPTTLTWVGDGPMRGAFAAECRRLGVDANVVVTGAVAPETVFELLEAAELFMLPTAGETFLVSAAEAISVGRPVVLARVGGFTDYVDEQNGVLVDTPTAEALVAGVLQARGRFSSVSAEAIAATTSERFSARRIATDFHALYEQLLD